MTILRDTLDRALAADPALSARFYDRLFAAHPELRAMFQSPDAQQKKLAQTLSAIVDHVDDPAWLDRELGALAASHATYGVTSEMYGWVAIALISTIADACGDAWTAQADRAWRAAYTSIAKAMINAPDAVR